jgi:hypothetical protein
MSSRTNLNNQNLQPKTNAEMLRKPLKNAYKTRSRASRPHIYPTRTRTSFFFWFYFVVTISLPYEMNSDNLWFGCIRRWPKRTLGRKTITNCADWRHYENCPKTLKDVRRSALIIVWIFVTENLWKLTPRFKLRKSRNNEKKWKI